MESVRIADAVNHPASLTLACWAAGLPHLGGGNLPRAIPPLERALRIVQEADLPIFHHWVGPSLGSAYALAGRVEEAVSLLERAVDQDIALPIMSQHSLTLAYLGEAYHLAGRAEDAGTLAHRALSLSRTQDERGHQAWALRLLGEITSRHDPPDVEQAEDHYRQALALAEELGMRPLQAHCHFGLGKLYRKVGRMEEARVELATAVEMFRSMEMTHWLPQAEAELAEAATPLPSP
jgi:tetratricopeptide (TPR) repeat protein